MQKEHEEFLFAFLKHMTLITTNFLNPILYLTGESLSKTKITSVPVVCEYSISGFFNHFVDYMGF